MERKNINVVYFLVLSLGTLVVLLVMGFALVEPKEREKKLINLDEGRMFETEKRQEQVFTDKGLTEVVAPRPDQYEIKKATATEIWDRADTAKLATSAPIKRQPIGTFAGSMCRETDNGADIYAKGSVTGKDRCIYDGISQDCDRPVRTVTDICSQGSYEEAIYGNKPELSEFYCGIDGRITVQAFLCPAGCQDGACKRAETPKVSPSTCQEDDQAGGIFAKGTAASPTQAPAEDYCADDFGQKDPTGHRLMEHICRGNIFINQLYICPEGCHDGACLR